MKIEDIAAAFQSAVVEVLVRKTEWAIRKKGIRCVALSGNVSANRRLRAKIKEMGKDRGVKICTPSPALCTDNAAMIAAAGYHHALRKRFGSLHLNPHAALKL